MGDLLQRFQLIWAKVNPVQRVMLITLLLLGLGGGGLLIHWARQPDMRPLYMALSPEDASNVMDKVAEEGITADLRNGGTSVYVPQEHIYRLRNKMAKEGVISGGQKGFRIFDDTKIGASPFQNNVNYKRALQDELAKTIQWIEGVSYARVLLDVPETLAFSSQITKAEASVMVRLQPGYRLSKGNVAAITNLVAGSVAGLEPRNVTVVDGHGALLSNPADQEIATAAGSYLDYKTQVETSLQNRVETHLERVVGPQRSSVMVAVQLDMKQKMTRTETPIEGVERKRTTKTVKEKEPGIPNADGTSTIGKDLSDTVQESENENGVTVEQESNAPGEILATTVSVLVDLRPMDPNATGLIMEVNEVETLIRTCLGLKESDKISVSNTPFYQEVIEEIPDDSQWDKYMAIARQGSMGIMAVCALLALKIFSGAKKKAAAAEAVPALTLGAEGGLLPEGEGDGANTIAVQKQVAAALQSNPEQVRQLFSSWIEQG